MMKDGEHIPISEQDKRGCLGCPHYETDYKLLYEGCDLPKNECTYGE